jgi:hypothetical protein
LESNGVSTIETASSRACAIFVTAAHRLSADSLSTAFASSI